MDKKEVLLDSIKKLITLNVSEREILLNLKDIGVDDEQAKDLLSEAKGIPVKSR